MAEQQLARGLWTGFASNENPFGTPNGMDENLRTIDDHIALYTLLPVQPVGAVFPSAPEIGDGQIFSDGSYAVFNAGEWRSYGPRPGIVAMAKDGTEAWMNNGARWNKASVLDVQPAIDAAKSAILPLTERAENAATAAALGIGTYYSNIDEGRLSVGDGQSFWVEPNATDPLKRFTMFTRISNDEQVRKFEVVTFSDVKTIQRDARLMNGRLSAMMLEYSGAGRVYPVLLDASNKVLLGYDAEGKTLVGDGLVNVETVSTISGRQTEKWAGKQWYAEYTGDGPVFPIVVDASNKVLLGYDLEAQILVGPGIGGSVGNSVVIAPAVPLSSDLRPMLAAINHFIFYGQSLSVGARGTPVISATQPYGNLTFAGGPRVAEADFSSLKPLVEDALPAPDGGSNRGETPCSGAANFVCELLARENGIDPASHVILASTAGRGGTRIGALAKGGSSSWYVQRLLPHIDNGVLLAQDYAVQAIGWLQGEQDALEQLPYSDYYAALAQLQADIEADVKARTGQSGPVHLITYQLSYAAATWPDQALAQLALSVEHQKIWFATPTYHIPHASDNVHLSAIGYKWIGGYFGKAYKSLVIDGVEPQLLRPVSAIVRDNTVRVRFDVPHGPLVLDVDQLASTTNFGFRIVDTEGTVPVTNIRVVGREVVLSLGRAVIGSAVVRYALDYLGAGLSITGGASGNLRDSDPRTIRISGADYPLYNVCPHFSLPIISIGE